MNKNRLSPITIKKQSLPKSKRQSESSIEQQIEVLEQKIRKIRFSQEESNSVEQLWETLHGIKEAEEGIKFLNQSLSMFGESLNISSPQRSNKTAKNNQNFSQYSTNRTISHLLTQSQSLKNQSKSISHKISQAHTFSQMQRIKAGIQFKQQLSQRLKKVEQWLNSSISQTKKFATNSTIIGDEVIKNNLQSIAVFKQLEDKKMMYEDVLGMIVCRRKWIDDCQLKGLVRQRWDKSIERDGRTDNKKLKDNLISAQKSQTISKISQTLKSTNKKILNKYNNLRQFINTSSNNNIKQNEFHIKYWQTQRLIWQIQGTINNYEQELQKIQETLYLSKPKTHFIQYKDPELIKVNKQLIQVKEKWLEMMRLLEFQYCM